MLECSPSLNKEVIAAQSRTVAEPAGVPFTAAVRLELARAPDKEQRQRVSRGSGSHTTGSVCIARSVLVVRAAENVVRFALHHNNATVVSSLGCSHGSVTTSLVTHKVGDALPLGLAVALLTLQRHLRVVPLLHHKVLHRLGFLLGRERRARLDLPDLRLQRRLLVLRMRDVSISMSDRCNQ